MTPDEIVAAVFDRNRFYRRHFHMALGALALAWLCVFFLIGCLLYVIRNPTEPLYFATDDMGRLLKVVPVSQPNMSDEDVGLWVMKVAQQANSFDYVNYRRQLQNIQGYFTDYGWVQFKAALKASNNMVGLISGKMIFDAVPQAKPQLMKKGVLSGSYAWKFELPLAVTYIAPPYDLNDKENTYTKYYIVSMIVMRRPILQSRDGLGVVQLIVKDAAPAG